MAWHSVAEAGWVAGPGKVMVSECYGKKPYLWLMSKILDRDCVILSFNICMYL